MPAAEPEMGDIMEDRITTGLYLEATDLSVADYGRSRASVVLSSPGALRATWWTNAHRDRTDLPRTLPEFSTLGVYEVDRSFVPPASPPDIRGHLYHHYRRPGQGSLTGLPTNGILLVWISPKHPEGAQDLRDWADF